MSLQCQLIHSGKFRFYLWFQATHLGSSESLDSIRSRYLSLSKPQTISGSYTFSEKLVVDNDLTCPKINVVNNVDQEGFMKTYQSDGVSIDTSYKFKDWRNRVSSVDFLTCPNFFFINIQKKKRFFTVTVCYWHNLSPPHPHSSNIQNTLTITVNSVGEIYFWPCIL